MILKGIAIARDWCSSDDRQYVFEAYRSHCNGGSWHEDMPTLFTLKSAIIFCKHLQTITQKI